MIIRHAQEVTGNVSMTCRYYVITRQAYWSSGRLRSRLFVAGRLSFPERRRFWAELGEVTDEDRDDVIARSSEPVYLFAKSEFFRRPLPGEAVAALLETFSHGQAPGESRELDFMAVGRRAQPRAPPTPRPSSTARSCSNSSRRW